MKYNRCGSEIEHGEAREHFDRVICEDCYMDVLSPMRSCDPWSTHSAKSFEKHTGDDSPLTSTQSEILNILKETGGSELKELIEKLGVKLNSTELQREVFTLRHMEKIGAKRKGDQVIWQLW